MAGESPAAAAPAAAARVLVATTTAFLFLAPFAGSAGLRAGTLTVAGLCLLAMLRGEAMRTLLELPRGVSIAALALTALAVASLAWSAELRYSLEELKPELLYPVLAFSCFFVAAREVDAWRPWTTALLLGTAGVMLALALQWATPVSLSRHSMDGGPGAWSTHLVLVAPFVIVLGWPRPWGYGRHPLLQGAALAVLLWASWESENRIVWLALGAQLVVSAALWDRLPSMPLTRGRMVRVVLLAAGLAACVAFAASIVVRSERLFERHHSATASLERDTRPRIWSAAWEQVRAAPWLGHGFGREIVGERIAERARVNPAHPPVRHAHNVFLDVALQLGLVGLAVFAALLVALAWVHARRLRDPSVAPYAIVGLAVLAGFLVKNLTDDFMHRHNGMVFWALQGMLLGLARRRDDAKR